MFEVESIVRRRIAQDRQLMHAEPSCLLRVMSPFGASSTGNWDQNITAPTRRASATVPREVKCSPSALSRLLLADVHSQILM